MRRFAPPMPPFALVGIVLLVALLTGCGGSPARFGIALDGRPAPDFTLTDQRGDIVALSDLPGKAVALTFIYTNCPDICLLTAQHLRQAYETLPASTRDRVALVAVTVDPGHDTPARLSAFTREQGLSGIPTWYALTGQPDDLKEVWQAYGIDPGTMLLRSAQHQHVTADENIAASPAAPGDVATLAHTDAVYLIDPNGRERAFGRSDADASALANTLAELTG